MPFPLRWCAEAQGSEAYHFLIAVILNDANINSTKTSTSQAQTLGSDKLDKTYCDVLRFCICA